MLLHYSNILKFLRSVLPLLFFWINGNGQCITYTISAKGDTLNCTDVRGRKQGKWVVQVPPLRGEPGYEEEGIFVNDKKEGVWRRYNMQGDLLAIENYRWGYKDGKQMYFNMWGDLLREESWKAANPEKPTEVVEVYDVNDPSKVYLVDVKMEGNTMKHGIWRYYEPGSSRVVKKENYILDKLDDGSGTANGIIKNTSAETGAAVQAASEKKEKPKPKEVLEYEKKNEGKKKIKVRTGQTGG